MHGLGQAMDTMDFMKSAWSHFKVPTSFTPTMDVEELDKRIADLRTVEQWLTLNLNMLRNTIQAMELQRTTLGALQQMASTFEEAMRPTEAGADDDARPTRTPSPFDRATKGQQGSEDRSAAATAADPKDASDAADAADATAMPAGFPTSFPVSPFALVNAFPFPVPGLIGALGDSPAPANDDGAAGGRDAGAPAPVAADAPVEESPPVAEPPRPSNWRYPEPPPPRTPGRSPRRPAVDSSAGSGTANAAASTQSSGPSGATAPSAAAGATVPAADAASGAATDAATDGAPDALAWWKMLQSSFQQIAEAAVNSQAAALEAASQVASATPQPPRTPKASKASKAASKVAKGSKPARGSSSSKASKAPTTKRTDSRPPMKTTSGRPAKDRQGGNP